MDIESPTRTAEQPVELDRTVMTQAARSLLNRLPELTDRLVGEFGEDEGLNFADELREHLWRLCHQGLHAALTALEQPNGDRSDLRLATETGMLWAGRGLQLDSLLRLYRLAGRVLWESLLQAAGPGGANTLVYQVGGVLRGIDQESTAAASSYRQEESRLLPRGRARLLAAIDVLLDGQPAGQDEVQGAAEALDLPPRGRYVVVVQRPGASRSLVAPQGLGTYHDMRFFWRRSRDADRLLVHLDKTGLDEVERVLRTLTHGHVGVGLLVEELAELPKSYRSAELAVRTCRERGAEIARFDRRLPQSLILAQPELAADLVREILGTVLVLPGQYRAALIDTFETWLRCDGSATAAARRLFCHRNTVLHRLRRLQDLTGRSLSKPNELVDLALALHAFRSESLAGELGCVRGGQSNPERTPTRRVPAEARPGQPMIDRTSGV